ncbi:hypothetical protein DENIS_3472 [Desulfonema ishimotonii]|uniref:Uncharacterized protein n=1 Tax=Desulfonema ishimotonii TaxID=45657 RepID=A0A401FZW7_9BACT|nr:phage holin, LLH family [Desulfonema ishimotonii]GBC62500.1 hypothetical protein DENIS_3472 [Desulfonema ishimotonii]
MFGKIGFYLRPCLSLVFSRAGRLLKSAATTAVSTVETRYGGATGEDKREMAFAVIEETLKSVGVRVADQLISLAIEIAVLRLKQRND